MNLPFDNNIFSKIIHDSQRADTFRSHGLHSTRSTKDIRIEIK